MALCKQMKRNYIKIISELLSCMYVACQLAKLHGLEERKSNVRHDVNMTRCILFRSTCGFNHKASQWFGQSQIKEKSTSLSVYSSICTRHTEEHNIVSLPDLFVPKNKRQPATPAQMGMEVSQGS